MELETSLNGRALHLEVEENELLLDVLRDRLGLTGTKQSCEVEVCGACTVLLNGKPVSSCMTLASEAHGAEVLTIEGLSETEFYARAEESFSRHAAVQCGFCTPGLLLTLQALVSENREEPADLREELSGNLCRCTGYQSILAAAAELMP